MAARTASAAAYSTLFAVSIRHAFYNDLDGRCPDLRVRPTPACAALMASLGILFRDLGCGFAVLIAEAKVEALSRYLAARGDAWTFLSFLLVPANPQFVSISSLPIDTDLRASNLHLSNLAVGKAPGLLPLAGSTPGDAAALYPVTGPAFAVATPRGRTARLVDWSGVDVNAPATIGGGVTRFDLSAFPYGLYSARFADASGKPGAPPRNPAAPLDRLYMPAAPTSLGLLDLLLARPKGAGAPAAAFPLRGGAVHPVELAIPFAARETVWLYYVVDQGGAGQFSPDLAISGDGPSFTRSSAQLPNGEKAELFTASEALPLRRRSDCRFRLTGERRNGGGGRDDIVVDRLPTAPPAPVWPAPSGDALQGASEIYVYV